MGDTTEISWCDSTFNAWIGCTKVSPACDNCYAERDWDLRRHRAKWGAGNPRVRTMPATWQKPLVWNRKPFCECAHCGWRGEMLDSSIDGRSGFVVHHCPACANRSLKPARRRVFCSSLSDVFDNEVDPVWRLDLFNLIHATQDLDWLLLTKRIGNAAKMLPTAWRPTLPGNLWLGATIATQDEADRDVIKLLQIPAFVRFLSMEPLLGPVYLNPDHLGPATQARGMHSGIDWVIAGGESGSKARPMKPAWVRSLRDQCERHQVAFHFKQWGEHAPVNDSGDEVHKVGKRLAGRMLDGRTHDAFPAGGRAAA